MKTPPTHPSPNFGPRRDGAQPDLVVIHYTAMDSADAACRTLCNPDSQVSAHYLIDPDGTLRSLVAEDMRAWHAGAGAWGTVTDVNSRSIGIELSNNGASPFAAPLMDALGDLLGDIRGRWAIAPERIIGHSDLAPGRKIDPGARFDWRRLWLLGCGIWPVPQQPYQGLVTDAAFAALARRFGYVHADHRLVLKMFRLRFRPSASGPVDATDMALISDLAARFPVDAPPLTA